MSGSTWAILIAALLGCVAVAFVCRHHRRSTGGVAAVLASRPDALRNAELIHVERLFRVSEPVRLVARIDRAYRLPSGLIVLVEFKTRWINRPYWSDVIQLSAQRLAMESQGQLVAPFGYVVVRRPIKAAPYAAHRVDLMTGAGVLDLVRRREDILAGRVEPRHASHRATCRTCAFRSECEGARLGTAVRRDAGAPR